MAKADLTAERLRELLHYDPETGVFTRIKKCATGANRKPLGEVNSIPSSNGYLRVGVDGVRHYAHRLAFLFMKGEWPRHQVDHKNRIRTDNRWRNLRQATAYQNMQNLVVSKKSISGTKGVTWHKSREKWRVRFRFNGAMIHVGYFSDLSDACARYREEIIKYHTHLPE